MSKLPELRQRVNDYIIGMELSSVEITQSGGWTFRYGSTRVFIDIREQGDAASGRTLVSIFAPVGIDVPFSPTFFEWVARNCGNWLFGHLGLEVNEQDPAKGSLLLKHTLLGDSLDRDEFVDAVAAVAQTAEDIDDEVVTRHGGTRAHES